MKEDKKSSSNILSFNRIDVTLFHISVLPGLIHSKNSAVLDHIVSYIQSIYIFEFLNKFNCRCNHEVNFGKTTYKNKHFTQNKRILTNHPFVQCVILGNKTKLN